jgi:ABC-type multidrug transport system fused ATPase/permease subunit
VNPLFGFFAGKLLFTFSLFPLKKGEFFTQRDQWTGLILMLAFAILILAALQKYIFGYVSENLTLTLRQKLFSSIMYKHVAWFDSKDKAPGVLTNILAEDVAEVRGLSTETISVYLEALLGLSVAVAIAFKFTWQMALIALGAAPLVVVGGLMMSRTQLANAAQPSGGKSAEDAYKEANAILSDIILNYRTIIGFGRKNIEVLMAKYEKLLEFPK